MSEDRTFGTIDAPQDLALREGETIEWFIKYRAEEDFRDNSCILHANNLESVERAFRELKFNARILKIEYLGTYHYL